MVIHSGVICRTRGPLKPTCLPLETHTVLCRLQSSRFNLFTNRVPGSLYRSQRRRYQCLSVGSKLELELLASSPLAVRRDVPRGVSRYLTAAAAGVMPPSHMRLSARIQYRRAERSRWLPSGTVTGKAWLLPCYCLVATLNASWPGGETLVRCRGGTRLAAATQNGARPLVAQSSAGLDGLTSPITGATPSSSRLSILRLHPSIITQAPSPTLFPINNRSPQRLSIKHSFISSPELNQKRRHHEERTVHGRRLDGLCPGWRAQDEAQQDPS